LRTRVLSALTEVHDYRTKDAATSVGLRLEFWRKSAGFIAEAPLIGHGTGSTAEMFRRVAPAKDELSAVVTENPHNQTLAVGIQLGFAGIALLYAMWIAHLWLFRAGGFVAWLGFGVVVQNIVACLFNSFLFEFAMGWLYVFAVGVLGAMVLRNRNEVERPGA
jgi:O-antigen ligase